MSTVFNLGIGGETSADLLDRFPREVPHREPEVVVIGTGMNDVCREGSPEAGNAVPLELFRANVEGLIHLAPRGSRVGLAGLTPVDERRSAPLDGCYYFNRDLQQFDGELRALSQRHGVEYIDFVDAFGEPGQGFVNPDTMLIADGIHPNESGHEKMAQVAASVFARWYPLVDPSV